MMSLTWYILGILTIGAGYFLYTYAIRHRLPWYYLSGLIMGIASMLFSAAWAVGSMLEGVPRAASMGLLLFGMGGTVILTVTIRLISRRS